MSSDKGWLKGFQLLVTTRLGGEVFPPCVVAANALRPVLALRSVPLQPQGHDAAAQALPDTPARYWEVGHRFLLSRKAAG